MFVTLTKFHIRVILINNLNLWLPALKKFHQSLFRCYSQT